MTLPKAHSCPNLVVPDETLRVKLCRGYSLPPDGLDLPKVCLERRTKSLDLCAVCCEEPQEEAESSAAPAEDGARVSESEAPPPVAESWPSTDSDSDADSLKENVVAETRSLPLPLSLDAARRCSDLPDLPSIAEDETEGGRAAEQSVGTAASSSEESVDRLPDDADALAAGVVGVWTAGEEYVLPDELDLPPGYSEDEERAPTLRNQRGRATKLGASNRCLSQVIESVSGTPSATADVAVDADSDGALDRHMSASTPSIDSVGVDVAATDAASSAGDRPPQPKKPVRAKKSPTSKMPIMIGPHQVSTMVNASFVPSKQPSKSHSQLPSTQLAEKNKNIKRSTGSFSIFRFGQGSSRHKEKVRHQLSSVEGNVSATCGVCDKRFPHMPVGAPTSALKCAVCSIVLHERCKAAAGLCRKAPKHSHDTFPKAKSTAPPLDARVVFDANHNATDSDVASDVERKSRGSSVLEDFPQWVAADWADLDLWVDEPEAWSVAFKEVANDLGKKETKKQDVIHEFYITEKHHCQTLVILKQVYWAGLLMRDVLELDDVQKLIPDVLDVLLDFHLGLLRRVRRVKTAAIVVSTISDIIVEEFSTTGERRIAAVAAYVAFCAQKEASNRFYHELVDRNNRCKQFFGDVESNLQLKDRTLVDCTLLVTQRLTKYPVLVEQLLKHEPAEHRESTAAAVAAVKRMTREIDAGLAALHFRSQWLPFERKLDRSSVAKLHGQPFTAADLISFEERKVLFLGKVFWHNVARKPEEVHMILFDDVIVFLQCTGERYGFFAQDQHEAVLSLTNLLIREKAGKGHAAGVFLVVLPPITPDMYDVSFRTKKEQQQWWAALQEALRNRQPVRRLHVQQPLAVADAQHTDEYCHWLDDIKAHFALRDVEERRLHAYFTTRVEWFEQLRALVRAVPHRHRADLASRMQQAISDGFDKLKRAQGLSLAECVVAAQQVQDAELPSFWDDERDARVELSWSDQEDVGDLEDSSSSVGSEWAAARADSAKQPRRNLTFHAPGDRAVVVDDSIRRHTTVPDVAVALRKDRAATDAQCLDVAPSKARMTAARFLIEEIAALKTASNRLRNDNASLVVQLAAANEKARAGASTETLEMLRQAQAKLQAEQQRFAAEMSDKAGENEFREQQLKQREAAIARQDEEIIARWAAVNARFSNGGALFAFSEERAADCSPTSASRRTHSPLGWDAPTRSPSASQVGGTDETAGSALAHSHTEPNMQTARAPPAQIAGSLVNQTLHSAGAPPQQQMPRQLLPPPSRSPLVRPYEMLSTAAANPPAPLNERLRRMAVETKKTKKKQ